MFLVDFAADLFCISEFSNIVLWTTYEFSILEIELCLIRLNGNYHASSDLYSECILIKNLILKTGWTPV